MSNLLEAAAALGVSAAVVVLMVTSLSSAVRVHAAGIVVGDELFEARQLEHLLDRATLAAGGGPTRPSPISSISYDTVVFTSDHNGDGAIDSTSSETTALEVRQFGAQARVRVRLGRQTMTVRQVNDSEASIAVLDPRGEPANAATATLVELSIADREGSTREAGAKRMLFSLPASSMP